MKDYLDQIDACFKQFDFSIKLWQYIKEGHIDLARFDDDLTVQSTNRSYQLKKGTFRTNQMLVDVSRNIIGVSFGAAAITLSRAIEKTGWKPPLKYDSEKDQLASLMYMVRCCFAHDFANPKWCISRSNRRRLSIDGIEIDLHDKHGVDFDYSHIGGAENLRRFLDLAYDWFLSQHVNSGDSQSLGD